LVKHKGEVGYRQVIWDGRNDQRKQVRSGIYFYKIKTGEFGASKKMAILK
jgi:hypothetical protein